MSQEKIIDPNKPEKAGTPLINPKIVVKKQKNDIVERKDQRILTEDGKDLLI